MKKIGFIGIGNMGGAILAGYAQSENAKNMELLAFDMNSELCSSTKEKIPQLELCSSGSELCKIADTVIIGVKPQVIGGVLEEIAGSYDSSKTVISMAAGISIEKVQRYLGDDAKIIRIMPNTPAKVGEAMVAMCRNDNVSDEIFDEATEIFAGIGRAEHIDESLIDCVIGVSGSSPAYTYMYIQALIEAAAANGMDEQKARVFAAQSVLGAARMVLESSESVEQLRINVCSPNGTTIEAVDRLFANGFMDDVKEGFQAAVDRSIEMGKEE